ncbi:MAG TPA: hypothetical protein VJ975_08325 [Candidatus Limnocylindria bacterium]|nr:hypothetical protein [Candidatus Limnocylindria bacterium]
MTLHPDSTATTADDRHFLEVLCLWRGLYGHRGPQDRLAVASVTDTIESAELRIRLRRHHDEAILRRFTGGWPPSPTRP